MSTMSPSCPAADQIAQRQHVRAEAKLKIHCGDEPQIAADVQDRPRGREIFAHRLLNQHRRAARQVFQHARDLIAGNGDIEDRIRRTGRFGERCKDLRHAEALRRFARHVRLDVVNAGDGKFQALVNRQVRGAHDAAGADDDDRAAGATARPMPAGDPSGQAGFRMCAADRRRGQWPALLLRSKMKHGLHHSPPLALGRPGCRLLKRLHEPLPFRDARAGSRM